MSLIVHLPLNGDLKQQGLSNKVATNNGATVNTSGKIGQCYSFNGSSNYITLPQGYFGTNWSYALWVYTASTSATQTLGCCRTAVGSGFSIFLIGGKLRIDPGGNNIQWTTTYTFPANTWFHLAVTCEAGQIKYYINGEYKQSYSATVSSSYWGSVFSIGASQAKGSGYGNYLNGRLNDVRIYNHCLSVMEIKKLSQGLVLHYPLNNNGYGDPDLDSGNIEYDCSGYCNNGTRTGTFSWTSDTPKYDISTVFNGSGLRISSSALPAETMTLSVWAKTTKNKNTAQCILGDSASGLCLFMYGGGLITYFRGSNGGTGSRVTFGNEYIENGWNHLVVVKTGDTTRDAYCNGVKLTTAANNYYTHAEGFWIGARNASNALPFYGNICDVRAYVTALSADDILALYQNSAYIDNHGNAYTANYVETSATALNKQGVFSAVEIDEETEQAMIKDSGELYSPIFYEI